MSTQPDEEPEERMVYLGVEVAETHKLMAVVVVTYDPETGEHSTGIKPIDQAVPYKWVIKRLRALCTELELQAMLAGEEGEPDDDSDSGDGES